MSIAISNRWITAPRYDILWYLGSCVLSYAIIFAHFWLAIPALVLWWFWIVTVDGPHIFGTLSRTYLDREEWLTRRKLLIRSLLWFIPGPVSIAAGLILNSRLPLLLFLLFAQIWAYWHVVRQHYGFMTLYQKKNSEPAGKQNPVDYWCFYVLMIAPFVSFIIRHPEARERLMLSASISGGEQWVTRALTAAIASAAFIYLYKELGRIRKGEPWNLPKNIFLLSCVPLHLLIFLHPGISTGADLILYAAFVTYYHNVQYHGIVWFYNRNRYGKENNSARFGLASVFSKNFAVYYSAGLLFTLIYQYANWTFSGIAVPFSIGPNRISELGIGSLFTVSEFAIALWWGFALNHYYVDQHIWKVSKDRTLNRDLKIEEAHASKILEKQNEGSLTSASV